MLIPSIEVYNKAIEIRKDYNLSLGDSLIAATALVQTLTLYTRNLKDFSKVTGLKINNPVI